MVAGHGNNAGRKNAARRPTDLDARIGRLIRERRRLLGLTQEALARTLGITQHQLQKYETGGNRIAASRLVDCAMALEVPIAWFYQSTVIAAEGVLLDAKVPDDERSLLEVFRELPPAVRVQLVGVARVLRGKEAATTSKARKR